MITDEEIKKNVVDHLEMDSRVDASNIKVTVNAGKVKLEGRVPSFYARKALEEDTWITEGVIDVDERVKINQISPPEVPGDEELERRVKKILLWSPEIRMYNINVDVKKLWVTLKGTVKSLYEKNLAEKKALDIWAVVGVTNEIAVVPTEKQSDKILAKNVIRSLKTQSPVNVDEVNVFVKDQKVTLTGEVPTWFEKREAYRATMITPGIVSLDNNLTIERLKH